MTRPSRLTVQEDRTMDQLPIPELVANMIQATTDHNLSKHQQFRRTAVERLPTSNSDVTACLVVAETLAQRPPANTQ